LSGQPFPSLIILIFIILQKKQEYFCFIANIINVFSFYVCFFCWFTGLLVCWFAGLLIIFYLPFFLFLVFPDLPVS